MALTLLVTSVVIISCIAFNKLSSRWGIPTLLIFILLGMFFGSDGFVKIPFENYSFAEQICSVSLIFIMFYGGFGTRLKDAICIAPQSILLSTLGVLLTALLTGLFCHVVLAMPVLESFLIGAVISSTDAASVFSILRSKRLNLKLHTASMLEVESGSNDPFSYMLTLIALSLMLEPIHTGSILYMLFAQVVYGILIGILVACIALWILNHFQFVTAGFDAAFVLATALLAYALPSLVGGNGYLSVYLVGLILGNRPLPNKRALVHFFDGITGLMQMLIFFLLGLLAFPSLLPSVLLPALAIALFLTFIARPLAVGLILTPFKAPLMQQLLVSWSGLRGASSIVFAILATISPAYTQYDLFHIVFCIVMLSITFQGTLLPFVAKKLHMIDPHADVLKTFTDYTEEVQVQFIELILTADHPWANQSIHQLILPPHTLLVMLMRQGQTIIPNGNTVLLPDDIVILSAPPFESSVSLELTEFHIQPNSKWTSKTIAEFSPTPDHLVIMIKRGEKIVIPNGTTIIEAHDTLVMSSNRIHKKITHPPITPTLEI